MKFRVADPCPHCECTCEEYNEKTSFIGCPACERPREVSLANGKEYEPPIDWEWKFNALAGIVKETIGGSEECWYDVLDWCKEYGYQAENT